MTPEQKTQIGTLPYRVLSLGMVVAIFVFVYAVLERPKGDNQ
jgi:hypothetical protein